MDQLTKHHDQEQCEIEQKKCKINQELCSSKLKTQEALRDLEKSGDDEKSKL